MTEDGEFGPSTEASVTHYQQNENLTVDGVVGRQTWTSVLTNGSCSRNPVRTVKWVDRTLKGEKPAVLPVQAPTK